MILVGLPDTALREARDRIRAAIANSGEQWPQRKITVGLSPASLPKRGSWFDLAIAVGVLTAAGTVPAAASAGVMFFGELGLDGRLRPVRGVLPAVAAAADDGGFGTVMVAEQNAAEAALVPGVRVIAASTLTAVADWLRGTPGRAAARPPPSSPAARNRSPFRLRGRRPTWPRCSASRWPGEPPRCARRAVITCRCSARPGRARPCWPSGFPPFCRALTGRPRWK